MFTTWPVDAQAAKDGPPSPIRTGWVPGESGMVTSSAL